MTSKDALELLNMFTEAAQIAKRQNKFECKWEVDETTLANLLKKAFPKMLIKLQNEFQKTTNP